MYVFTATADMSADGVYDVALNVTLANDSDTSNNNYSTQGENKYTPGAPTASGDTVCAGDTATLSGSSADGPITWYDAMTGGNAVGSGDMVHVTPTATTSYYAEAKAASGFSDDFESYNAGDYIVQSNPTNWATWPGGTPGGLYDAIISSAQAASGSNSLHLDNAAANVPDPVLPFGGQTWTSGSFEFSTNMYVETTAYFNLQGSANIGTVWAMEMTFTGAGGLNDPFTFDLGGGTLTGNYPGTGVWFNVTLKCADLTTGTWELFIDGVSQGTATIATGNAVGGCNLYAAAGNNYYVDDISWHAVAADACTSTRTEAVVTVLDCSNITELSQGNMDVYPNPNNGEFVITTSNEVMNVTITDVRGKVVYTNNKVNNKTINVNLSDLEKGMYMINVETTNGTMTENIIVQ
jgi:galactitol-specific phosphotransferase system IIB component